MTGCAFGPRLSAYLDGDLPAEAAEEVRRHLAERGPCGCVADLAALRGLVGDLRSLEPGPAPPGGWGRVERALDRRRSRRWEWALPAAAVLLLGAALAILWPRPQPAAAPPAVAAGPAPLPAPGEVEGLPPEETAPAPPLGGGAVGAVRLERARHAPASLPPPRFQLAAARVPLAPTRLPDDLVVAYGTEIAPIDRLLAILKELPQSQPGQPLHGEVEHLEDLRADVLAELVLQAQARQAAPWR